MPNPERAVLPGQFTKVKILLDVREDAVVVPVKSLIVERGASYVYVMLPSGKVEKRFVEIGPEVDNRVVIERGLVAGEMVVVEGQHKLSPGMEVTYKTEEGE